MEKLLYRVDEAAKILSVSKRSIYRMIDEGKLIAHNDSPGRKGLRVTAESINAHYEKYQSEQ